MSDAIQKIKASARFLEEARPVANTALNIGVILGTGLGEEFLSDAEVNIQKSIDYKDIPGFISVSHADLHNSMRLHYAAYKGKQMVILQGRLHYYEGYSMQDITFPVRVLGCMGIKTLLLSNAAGNMRRDWHKGQLMLLEDHINLQPDNPLRGPNLSAFGSRFVDMSAPYAPHLQEQLSVIAQKKNIPLHKGVYAAVIGPQLETRAEYRYLQRIGADAVGMSTVPEVLVANHMGMACCAVSVLTDDCDPDNLQEISVKDVMAAAARGESQLSPLYLQLLALL